MVRHHPSILLLVTAILTFSACAKNRVDLLSERTEAYNRSVRWASVTAASTFLAEDVRRKMAEELAVRLGNDRIVEYAVVDLGVDPKREKASVVVQYSYYDIRTQNLQGRQELQSWEWNQAKKNWFLKESRELSVAPVGPEY